MTPLAATQLVYAAIRTGWADRTNLGFDGEFFVRPKDEAYVYVAIRGLPNRGSTHGRPGQRLATRRAMVMAQCFAPTNDGGLPVDGIGAAMALAATLQPLLEGRDLGSAGDVVNLEVGDTLPIGADGAFYQANVTVPFTFLESF